MPRYRYAFFKILKEYFGDRFKLYHSDLDFEKTDLALETDAKYLDNAGNFRSLRKKQTALLSISVGVNDLFIVGGNIRDISTMILLY